MHRRRSPSARFIPRLLAIALIACAAPASAQGWADRSGSILIFPEVVSAAGRDTLIEMSNVGNNLVKASCFYVDGELLFPQSPPGPLNQPICESTSFDLTLTRQQPTFWVASQGRPVKATDADTGLDPGAIPPTTSGFTGYLMCIEVDSSGLPVSGNHLSGVATLRSTTGLDLARYEGVALQGNEQNDGNNLLCAGGGVSADCPNGAEYDGCPASVSFDHLAHGAEDPLVGGGSTVSTSLSVVPCMNDLENQIPGTAQLQFVVHNEFESAFSTSTTVTCWGGFSLHSVSSAFDFSNLGSTFAQTKVTPSGAFASGFLAVMEETHDSGGATPVTASAAQNTNNEGARAAGDIIALPFP